MFSRIHSYFSKQLYNRYDFINGMLLGVGIATNQLWPLAVVAVLFALTFINSKDT